MLWDRQVFLNRVFQALERRVRRAIRERAELFSRSGMLASASGDSEPVNEVPYRHGELLANQYRLLEARMSPSVVADVGEELLRRNDTPRCVVIGEAGCGKSTAALLALRNPEAVMFFVNGAELTHAVKGAKAEKSGSLDILNSEYECEPSSNPLTGTRTFASV